MQSKYIWIIGGLSTALVGASSAAVAVPLVIKNIATNRAHDALSNFVDLDGGKPPEIDPSKRLNVVALGDSITAGYNGFAGKDMFSYADVLGRDILKSVGGPSDVDPRLSYHNYANDGAKIGDVIKTIRIPDVQLRLYNADVITLSISSNDLMAITRLFHIGTASLLNLLMPNPGGGGGALSLGDDKEERAENMHDILQSLFRFLNDPKAEDSILLDAHPVALKVGLDFIKRDLMVLMHDLHALAPNAHIKFIFPEFPFDGLPDWLINKQIPNFDNLSIKEFYQTKFKSLVKDAVSSDYTQFLDFNDLLVNGLKYIKGHHDKDDFRKRLYDHEKGLFNQNHYQEIINKELMHNLADIHPSNTGHLVAGNELFRELAGEIKKPTSVEDEEVYQKFSPGDDAVYKIGVTNVHDDFYEGHFVNADEIVTYTNGTTLLKNELLNDSLAHKLSNLLAQILGNEKALKNPLKPLLDFLMPESPKPDEGEEVEVFNFPVINDPDHNGKIAPSVKGVSSSSASDLLRLIEATYSLDNSMMIINFLYDQIFHGANAATNKDALAKYIATLALNRYGDGLFTKDDDGDSAPFAKLLRFIISQHQIKPVNGVYSVSGDLDITSDLDAAIAAKIITDSDKE